MTRRVLASSSTTPRLTGENLPISSRAFMIVTRADKLINRPAEKFKGKNHIHFGDGLENYVTLPVIPPK